MATFTDEDRRLFNRLVDESACRQLLECYSNVVDWKNWARLDELVWDDAQFDFGMWKGNCAEFKDWVKALEDGYERRLHLFSIQRIIVDGDSAQTEIGLANYLRSNDENGESKDDLLFGRYQIGLQKRDGQWRMQSLKFFLHGVQRFNASDEGGADLFADNLDSAHAHCLR